MAEHHSSKEGMQAEDKEGLQIFKKWCEPSCSNKYIRGIKGFNNWCHQSEHIPDLTGLLGWSLIDGGGTAGGLGLKVADGAGAWTEGGNGGIPGSIGVGLIGLLGWLITGGGMGGGLGLRVTDGVGAWTYGGVPGSIGEGFSTAACGGATGRGTSVGSGGAITVGGAALYTT
jgi:hypothetical protein